MSIKRPVEKKVTAATVGAGTGAVLAAFLLWLLDGIFWGGPGEPDVPAPVSALITLVVAAGLAYWAGWQADHTPRDDLTPPDPETGGSHVAP